MGTEAPAHIVIADTSVLINFLRVNRVGLLARLSYEFLITDNVHNEVTTLYPDQLNCLKEAIEAGIIRVYRVESPEEHALLLKTRKESRRLGVGEASALAAAVLNKWTFAVDDKAAIKHCRKHYPSTPLIGTADLMCALIQHGALTVQAADVIKDDWAENHSFRLKLGSFADLI